MVIIMQLDENLTNKPYFYSNFQNTNEVAEFLRHKSKGNAGYFLVRPSFKNPNNLTVSVVVKDKTVRHTNIIVNFENGYRTYYLVKEKQFRTVQDLLDYYRTNDVKNLEKVNHVRFLMPVLRNLRRSFDDNSSTSSDPSILQPPNIPAPPPPDRPPLPDRPSTLQRRPLGSGSSSSQTSVFGGASIKDLSGQEFYPDPFSSPTSPNRVERPPAPLPGGHKTGGLYYSTPRNVEEDISERLKEVLKQNERCDCGIPRDMADLPLGWTVHRSKDATTYGRLFFQNVQGVTTWKVPADVQFRMTAQQNHNIRVLKDHFSVNPHIAPSSFPSVQDYPTNSSDDVMPPDPGLGRRSSNMAVFQQNVNITTKF